ncbi:MAG: xanthine dehydrogenase family protein subunit M [Pseudomonadales bacterium]
MYPAPFRYHRPGSLQEAIGLLAKLGDDAKVIAGGQTLLPMLKMRMGDMTDMIDIGRLPNLNYIEQRGDCVHIGALTTHAEIAASDIAEQVPLLKDCGGGIADKQVRSLGTIGGALSVADPSGDWPAGLRALNAQVVCRGPKGTRTLSLHEFILGAYATALDDGELVTEVVFKLPPKNSGGAYLAFKRAAAAYPTATAGVQLTMRGDSCEDIRLVLGSAGSTAITSSEAEAVLRGETLTSENIAKAADIIVAASSPPVDARGSEEFKRAMLRSLVIDAVARAVARSRGEAVTGGHRYA